MIKMMEMDEAVAIRDQLGEQGDEPVILVNVFHAPPDGIDALLAAWADDANMPDRDPTLEEMQGHAREVTGDVTLTLTDPIWFSHSRFQHGVAPRYAAGRVFLAGDAGHHTLPIGGQGMNAGMTDGIGLAWRLAMTLAGHRDSRPDAARTWRFVTPSRA